MRAQRLTKVISPLTRRELFHDAGRKFISKNCSAFLRQLIKFPKLFFDMPRDITKNNNLGELYPLKQLPLLVIAYLN
jgi:hypothetical protein